MSLTNLAAHAPAYLAAHAPAWYDLLNTVGLQRRRSAAARAAMRASWFGLGVLAGGGLAVLLTPRSGPEMRERLSDQARRARDYMRPDESERPPRSPLAAPSRHAAS